MKKFTLALATLALSVASMNATDYYLVGGFNNWTTSDPACLFTETAQAGVYELNYTGTLNSGFKINDGAWSDQGGTVDLGSNGTALVVGQPYALKSGGGNIAMSGSIENPKLTLDVNSNTLTVAGQTQETEFAYGIHGDIFGVSTWSTENMTDENGKWVLTASIVPGGFGIKVMDKKSGTQVADPDGSDWYSSADGGTVTVNTPMAVSKTGTNWTSDLEGNYSFTFDPKAMTLIIASASLWNDITADENATFAIYTIEGNIVKASANAADVENLENGMYIINGEKVMICK